MALRYFLLMYDRNKGQIASIEEFESATHASAAYAALEAAHGRRVEYEIVLLGADSLETLKATHSRYWENSEMEVPF